mgnify:CR=1 FL=1
MINIDTTDASIKELLFDNQIDIVIHGCNCFHKLVGPVAQTLKDLTANDIAFVDINFSPYGDINNLGTYTNGTFKIANKPV